MVPKKPRPFGILEFFAHGGELARKRWEKWIDRSPNEKGCWIWTGFNAASVFHPRNLVQCRFPMKLGEKRYRTTVARIAWSLHHNIEFPYDLFACHTCDNARCVNPDHIWVGSVAQNNHDAIRKGRKGVSYEKRASILEMYMKGATYEEIVTKFNLANKFQVSTILQAPDVKRKYGVTVPQYRRKIGITSPRKKKRSLEERIRCVNLYLSGTSTRDIAKQLNVTYPRVGHIFRNKDLVEHYGEPIISIKRRLLYEQGKRATGYLSINYVASQSSKRIRSSST